MVAPARFSFDQAGPTPDPAWQAALHAIAPRTEYDHSWLKLVWEPGERWCPVERWIIYEMLPPWRAPLKEVWDDLRGPNPRWYGGYDRALGRFVSARPFLISRMQWVLYQETGCYGRPLWVVQGFNGGHKRYWRDIESAVSRARSNGLVTEPPAPGDLPYAEPDRRTFHKIRMLDRVQKYGDIIGSIASDPAKLDVLDFAEKAEIREMVRELNGWLDSQIEDSLTLTRAQIQQIRDHASPDAREPDYDQGEEELLDELANTYT